METVGCSQYHPPDKWTPTEFSEYHKTSSFLILPRRSRKPVVLVTTLRTTGLGTPDSVVSSMKRVTYLTPVVEGTEDFGDDEHKSDVDESGRVV